MEDCVKIPNSPSTSILFVVDLHKFNVVPEVVKYIFKIQLKLHCSYLSVMSSTPSNPAIASSHVLHVFVNLPVTVSVSTLVRF